MAFAALVLFGVVTLVGDGGDKGVIIEAEDSMVRRADELGEPAYTRGHQTAASRAASPWAHGDAGAAEPSGEDADLRIADFDAGAAAGTTGEAMAPGGAPDALLTPPGKLRDQSNLTGPGRALPLDSEGVQPP